MLVRAAGQLEEPRAPKRPGRKAVRSALCGFKFFWQESSGQDLVEYSLLMAFVCLASAALFIGVGRDITGIWRFSSSTMQNAYCAANASS